MVFGNEDEVLVDIVEPTFDAGLKVAGNALETSRGALGDITNSGGYSSIIQPKALGDITNKRQFSSPAIKKKLRPQKSDEGSENGVFAQSPNVLRGLQSPMQSPSVQRARWGSPAPRQPKPQQLSLSASPLPNQNMPQAAPSMPPPAPRPVSRLLQIDGAVSAVREALTSEGMDSAWTSLLAARISAVSGADGGEIRNALRAHGWSSGQFSSPPDRERLLAVLLSQRRGPVRGSCGGA